MESQEYIKKKDLINLTSKMIDKYVNNGKLNELCCPICIFDNKIFRKNDCILCFNRCIEDKDDTKYSCTLFLTWPRGGTKKYRLQYWRKVKKYAKSFEFENISLEQLRNKCNKIDKKLKL